MNRGKLCFFTGLAIILLIVLAAVFAPQLSPNDPYAVNLSRKLEAPSSEFPLGTDQLGRCVLSRLLYGARRSLGAAFLALIATSLLGSLMGMLAGFFGGTIDRIILWLCDIVLSFPGTLLALVIVGMFGSSLQYLVLAIAAVSWAGYARNVRSMVSTEKNSDYVKLAVVSGAGTMRVLFRHILPNVIMPAITLSISSVSGMIMRVASMSFIGLGAQLPAAEWGLMISASREVMTTHPRLILYAILAIFVTVMSLSLIGDGLRDLTDPHGGNR